MNDFETVSRAYRLMLQKLFDTVPNISRERSATGGFSNGAHTIGVLLAGQDEFTLSHFNSFYFVDGGFGPLAANVLGKTTMKSHRILLIRGEKPDDEKEDSKRVRESNTHLALALEFSARKHGLDFTSLNMTGFGHDFPPKYIAIAGQWVRSETLSKEPQPGETHFNLNRETLDAASVELEAEAGVLGSDYVSTNDGTAQFMAIQTDTLNRDSPGSSNRMGTYHVVFPAAGTYDLYARVRVKVDAADDSFFYGNGFGIKSPTNSDDWNTVNDLYQGGCEYPSDVVIGSGSAGSGVWKWLNVSQLSNAMTEPPITFTVAASNLVQTFQIGARENGFDIDRFVFGNSSYKFMVADLDAAGSGTSPPPRKPAADEKILPKLLREDFQIMRHALEEGHAGIYWYTRKADMDRTFDRAYRKIDHPMTYLEFWHLAKPVVAHIKCGHTTLWFPEPLLTQSRTTIPYLPFVTTVLGGRMFVYRDLVNPGSSLEGSEILSVNSVSMKVLLNEVRTLLTGDGNGNTAKDWRISHFGGDGIYLYALGIRSPFRVTYRTRDRKPHTIELEGLTAPMAIKKQAARDPQPDTNADLKFLDDGKIAVLTIRHWYNEVDPAGKVSFLEFLEQSFGQMQTNATRSLIIDVRDNTGGADPPGKQLFSFLWDQPFYYYKDIVSNARQFDSFKYDSAAKPIPADAVELRSDGKYHHLRHPNLGLQQPRQPHFSGKVFVLMNGGTFSASTEFLSTLHFHKRGTFIGEETGGGHYGNTSGIYRANLELPNSKLKLHFGLMTYYQAVSDDKYRDRGVLPDYPINHTIEDLMAGRDKDMELALSLARGYGLREKK